MHILEIWPPVDIWKEKWQLKKVVLMFERIILAIWTLINGFTCYSWNGCFFSTQRKKTNMVYMVKFSKCSQRYTANWPLTVTNLRKILGRWYSRASFGESDFPLKYSYHCGCLCLKICLILFMPFIFMEQKRMIPPHIFLLELRNL